MKKYRWYQISLIVLFSVIMNLGGRFFADSLHLPLWLDSFGTFLTAYLLGPICGIMVGISGNVIRGLNNYVAFAYSLTSVFIAFFVGYFSKKGWLKTYLKTMSLSILITVVCTMISCILNIAFYDGSIGNVWGQGICDYFENLGVPRFFSILLGQFYVDLFDKVFTLSALYLALKLYRVAKPHLPSFLCLEFDEESVNENQNENQNQENSENSSFGSSSEEKSFLKTKKTIFIVLCLALFGGFFNQKIYCENREFNSYVRMIYNKENGLPSGKTNDIASTRDGILWIGTYEGLYRYNGSEFYLMNDIPSVKTVRCLYVDNENRLFVGTNDEGLSILINEKVANVIDEDKGLPNNSVRCITRGANGLYYVGTSGQMAILSITDGLSIKKILPQIENAVSICADENGVVAVVTYEGKLFIIKGTEVIEENSSEKFTAVAFSSDGLLHAAIENNVVKIFAIDNGMVIKKNAKNVLNDESENENENSDENNLLSGESVLIKSEKELYVKNLRHINSLKFFEDILFACSDNGFGYFDDGVFYEIEAGSFNNSIDHMIVDYQGNLWFTSSRLGLLKMCKSPFSEIYLSAGLDKVVVNSVAKFNGLLYFGTDNGLTAISEETGRAVTNEITDFLKDTRIRCLVSAKNGFLWICTKTKGLICLDSDGKIVQMEKNRQFRVAKELSDGTIAVGLNNAIGFIKNMHFTDWITENDGLENSMILTLNQTNDGTVFAGTDGGGLAVIKKNGENWKLETLLKRADGLSSNVILRTVNDFNENRENGNFFVVTGNGLCYAEKKSATSKVSVASEISDSSSTSQTSASEYTIRYLSNFPYSDNFDMIITPEKNVFVLSSAGIFEVNRDELLSGQKLDYLLLDLKNGLKDSLTANSWNFLEKNGDLYLSCDSGVSRVNLNTFDKSDSSYRIQLNSILIDGKRYVLQKDTPCEISAENEKIEIIPEVINYSINNPLVSIYLEGFDSGPTILPQKSITSFSYNHLKAGSYVFHIQILDAKGIDVTEEATYQIIKESHIYDNWWFMLYVFGVAMIVIAWLSWYITFTVQSRRIEFQKKEVETIKQQVRMGNETIFAIANAVEARDKSTGRHSLRVADYSVLIARELGYSEDELENLHKIGLLHDIGKIGVPDSILNKPSKLTDEEYVIMKTHVDIGGEILKDFTLVPNVVQGAKYHHERYDGFGYPNGLKGEEIPLNARIIGISDAFDAMTANRVYRKALDMDFVIKELKRCKGTQFDPCLVDIMLELIESGKLKVGL